MSLKNRAGRFFLDQNKQTHIVHYLSGSAAIGTFFSVYFLGGLWLEPIAIKDFLTRHVQSIHACGSRSSPSRRNLNIVPTKLSNSTVNRTARL